MAKNHRNYLATKPGRDGAPGVTHRRAYVAEPNSQDFGYPANSVADAFESVDMGRITTSSGGPLATASGTAGAFTITIDSTGATTNGADGFVMTTAATSGNKVLLRHNRRFKTGGLGKLGMSRLQANVAAITASSIYSGCFNSSTDPIGTPPTNGVWITIVNGAVVGNVRGASGTLATVSLGTIVAATVFELETKFGNQVPAENNPAVTANLGEWWFNGARTPFTNAQLTQLAAMTGDLFQHTLVQTTTTVAQVLTVDQAYPTYDR